MHKPFRIVPWILPLVTAMWLGGMAAAQDVATKPVVRDAEARGTDVIARPKLNIAEALGQTGGSSGSGASEEHVGFSAGFTVQENSRRGTLRLTARIEPGWHVYSVTQQKGGPMASKIKVAESADFQMLGPFQPDQAPHIKHDKLYRVPLEEHGGTVTWTAPLELAEGVDPETLSIELSYSGQVCSDVCIPIANQKVQAKFTGYTPAPTTPGEYRPAEADVVFHGHIEPAAVTPRGKATLSITAVPTPGYHLYAYAAVDPDKVGLNKPTLIHLSPTPGWTHSAVKASAEPTVSRSKDGKLPDQYQHESPVTWTIELTVPQDAPEGEHVVSGYIGFQTCENGGGCKRPLAVQFRAAVPVTSSERAGTIPLDFIDVVKSTGAAATNVGEQSRSPAAAAADSEVKGYRDVAKLAAENPPTQADEEPLTASGLIVAALLGLLGGVILNLMPCVLPVIGIKVMSFAQQGGQSRVRVFGLNVAFVLGILVVFLVLATAAVFFGQNWGEQFTYLWFKVAMVVLVFAFALSFLGVWEVPIPGFAMSSTSTQLQQKEGASGAFFKGIFTTLLSTPCSGPLLGPLFLFALNQKAPVAYTIYACIALGMGAPYLIIGAFPSLVRWLPKPGAWMETFKQLMGFVLLATVVYLFWSIDAPYFTATLGLIVAVWFGLWIVGRVPIYEELPKQLLGWAGGLVAIAVLGLASFFLFAPRSEKSQQEHLAWQPYTEQSLAALQSDGKTVMLDFTANWCLTCQYNTLTAIDTPRVKAFVDKHGVVPMVADWTNQNPEIKAKLDELKSRSIPVLAIYPAGRPNEVIVLRDVVTESQVLKALEEAGPSQAPVAASADAKGETAMIPAGG